MPQSISKVYVHITFSTKYRCNTIDDKIENRLFEYIGGICRRIDCNALKVGGYRNHIHILCLLNKNITQVSLLEEIKKSSSKWIKTQGKMYNDFYWQDGYGIFSVNPKEIEIVKDYIVDQKQHHSKMSFEDELKAFLKKYKIEYDEKYLLD